jgi:hypothetical protein
MNFTPLGDIDLTYLPGVTLVEYGIGGQYYGAMEGTWRGDRISGKLRLTNIAQKRADNVNTPTLRGVLETDDGATMFVEMNGLSQIHEGGRVFVASLTLRTGHPSYQWVNTLLAVVEGELHGRPRANEIQAHCRVYACEATITHISRGGDHAVRAIAYALPVSADDIAPLQVLARDLQARSGEYGDLRERNRVAREAAFLQQRGEYGDHLIIYREFDDSSPTPSQSDAALESWLKDRVPSIHGFDAVAASQSKVELLVRQRPARSGNLHAAALPLLPDKVARLHQWALELNGIHAAEFEESLRRLGYGLTLFVQHTPDVDLLISVVEGDEPEAALGQLAISHHPFDQWHVHQIAELTGVNFSAPRPPPNKLLWAWESTAARTAAT